MYIANASGCSSAYGGPLPATPYCTDERGFGPSWEQSLFEDNAEFGFGFLNAHEAVNNEVRQHIKALADAGIAADACNDYLENWLDSAKTREVTDALLDALKAVSSPDETINAHVKYVLDRDEFVPEFRKLTGAVHAAGGRIALQIGHGGSRSIAPGKPVKPAEWLVSELDGLVESMADAAVRARDAGFDAVQLHGAHGYLLSEFLSPRFNLRTDAFGGSLENRARLLFRTFAAVRRAVGKDFPVLLKINSCDFVENGFSETDCAAVLRRLAAHGLSAVEISGGVPESGPRRSPVRMGKSVKPFYEDFAAQMRAELAIPVMLVGGIRDLATAERLVQTRVCDLVSLGRPLIAEPELPARWRDGGASVSVCTGCNRCFKPLSEGRGVRCVRTPGEGA